MRAVSAALAAVLLTTGAARAEPKARADEVRDTPSSEEAEGHFETALVHYRAGKYRSAIVELEKAYGVDPTGKDLVYNLAVVYEKLGELDSAIHYLERYLALEPDPDEIKRATDAIRRLRGAREELAVPGAAPAPSRPCPEPPARETPKRSGRFDEWVIVSGGVAIVSAVVGGVLGLKALDTRPTSDDVTGEGESRDELRDRAMTAKSLARLADVAFAVSLVSGSAAAILYFGRSPDVESGATVGLVGRF
jgi:tetratricopeptide (TPR) repeat protein